MRQVMVYLDDNKNGGRRLVKAELIAEHHARITVKLPDGNVITRRKNRDLPKESSNETL